MWAALNGHDEVVQILVERGADINAQGGLYGNALQAAYSGGHAKIVQILKGHPFADQRTSYLSPPPSKRLKL